MRSWSLWKRYRSFINVRIYCSRTNITYTSLHTRQLCFRMKTKNIMVTANNYLIVYRHYAHFIILFATLIIVFIVFHILATSKLTREPNLGMSQWKEHLKCGSYKNYKVWLLLEDFGMKSELSKIEIIALKWSLEVWGTQRRVHVQCMF